MSDPKNPHPKTPLFQVNLSYVVDKSEGDQESEKKTLDYKRNGIGVLFGKNEDYQKGAFWVLLIFGK